MQLGESFYTKSALYVAKNLIGKKLVRRVNDNKVLVSRIVETEAYIGPEDKACHAYNNKRTNRTENMFLEGGLAYIYLIYGLHHCLNVVTGPIDKPEAVLIRAVEPLEGKEIMKYNRKVNISDIKKLTNGPGKLCQALQIDMSLNGYNLVNGTALYITEDKGNQVNLDIAAAKRINIDYAQEYKDNLWRFYLKGNKFVSLL
ncbi:DNA-3-methyladenine glycosylase [Proteinivorax tanatarense]|uniref:Putative 3-methyladenine DNA glycosylase n=1 Tax=Proteinivorax tanatarense TaxID=1260629 RepID=A0AAU7VS43_9FIRM